MSTMKSERRPGRGVEPSQRQPEAVADRLAGLLPEEALQDALKGLEGQDITGPGGLLSQLAGRVIQTALETELTEHLGHPPGGTPNSSNVRNGTTSAKTVSTDLGPVEVRRRATAEAALSPSWWPSARPGWPGWMTRSSASTRAA
ncbi:MAG: family transposase [Solirubrobacterales bacterium]|nr:family transposase [Solirubrobacterales bacterium]